MKTITRFNQPNVLSNIGRYVLPELFDRFKNDLTTMNLSIPDPDLEDGPYYDTAAKLFNSCLPQPLLEAVLAIEELADPVNKDRLEQAFWDSPYELYLEPEASPECTALRLWLHAPYKCAEAPEIASHASLSEVVVPVGAEATAVSAPFQPTIESEPPTTLAPLLETAASPPPLSEPGVPKQPSNHSPTYKRRRTGKIACLPKGARERLNEMLSDGLTYRAIIKELGEEGEGLSEANLTSWIKGGYKDWLAEQKDKEEAALWEEYALDLVKQSAFPSLNEATIKMATLSIRKAIRAIGPDGLQTTFNDKPENYIRLLNALARLTTGAISCQSERAKAEQRQVETERQKADPDSLCLTAETLQKIEKLLRLR